MEPQPTKDAEQTDVPDQNAVKSDSKAEQVNGQTNGSTHPERELSQEAGAESAAPDAAEKEKVEEAAEKPEPEGKSTNGTGATVESKPEEPPKPADSSTAADQGDAVEEHARDEKVPSSILEKGVIYFFYRGRVNVEDPKNVQDLQRSFFVLRPIPLGAKIGDGSIGDEKNCRLIAIPKKMVPKSGNDKWTAFVETAKTSFNDLKENFIKSNSYDTQTGSSTTPAATPAAEGVYAITTTGRDTHLAYILTLPEELGDIQTDLGLRQKGSFIISVKNPKAPGPSNADLGKDPGYSQEILNTFRGLRWAPLQPEMLDYEACQFLMIGEGEDGLEKATEPQDGDGKKEETAKEEIEKLEEEDERRVEHLHGNVTPSVSAINC